MFCDKPENYHKKDIPKEILSQLKKIESNAGRLSNLINDLLAFSRVSNTDEKFVQTNLNEIVKNVLLSFDYIIKEKKAKIIIDSLPVIEAIPVEMIQLFHNLISNALKFSHANRKPKLTITSHPISRKDVASFSSLKEGQYIGIDVKDNGIGFPAEFAKQVFVIFQRLNEDKTKYPGTGIGLALCKKIVNFHNGIIYAEPKEGDGTSFHITLPVRHIN